MFVPVNRGTIFRTKRYLGLIGRLFVSRGFLVLVLDSGVQSGGDVESKTWTGVRLLSRREPEVVCKFF